MWEKRKFKVGPEATERKQIINWGLVDDNYWSLSSFHFHQPITLVCFCFTTCFVCLFAASLSPNFNFKLALLSRARPLALDRQGRPNWSRLKTNQKMECSDSGFQVLDSSICKWNLDSGFRLSVGIRIPWAVFQIPKLRIPDSIRKLFLDSGFHMQKYPGFHQLFYFSFLVLSSLHKIHYFRWSRENPSFSCADYSFSR